MVRREDGDGTTETEAVAAVTEGDKDEEDSAGATAAEDADEVGDVSEVASEAWRECELLAGDSMPRLFASLRLVMLPPLFLCARLAFCSNASSRRNASRWSLISRH